MRREKWMTLAALPAFLLAGDFFYWRIAVGELRDGFDAWVRRVHDSGWEVRHGAVSPGGWPNAATLRVEDMTIGGPATARAASVLSVGSDAVLLRVWLTRPTMLEIIPIRPRPIRVNEGPPILVSAETLRLRLSLRQDTPPRAVEVSATGFSATQTGLPVLNVQGVSLKSRVAWRAGSRWRKLDNDTILAATPLK